MHGEQESGGRPFTGCAHWGRALAHSLSQDPSPPVRDRHRIDSAIEAIRQHTAAGRDLGSRPCKIHLAIPIVAALKTGTMFVCSLPVDLKPIGHANIACNKLTAYVITADKA